MANGVGSSRIARTSRRRRRAPDSSSSAVDGDDVDDDDVTESGDEIDADFESMDDVAAKSNAKNMFHTRFVFSCVLHQRLSV